jgi:hypothetical protein
LPELKDLKNMRLMHDSLFADSYREPSMGVLMKDKRESAPPFIVQREECSVGDLFIDAQHQYLL